MKAKKNALLLASLIVLSLFTSGCKEAAEALLGGSTYVLGDWVSTNPVVTGGGTVAAGAEIEIQSSFVRADYTMDAVVSFWEGTASPVTTSASYFVIDITNAGGSAPTPGVDDVSFAYLIGTDTDTATFTIDGDVFYAVRVP